MKVWERFTDAAAAFPDIDLTVFYLGPEERVVERGEGARFHILPPAFGTERLLFLNCGAGHTDLARRHRGLEDLLPAFDLVVTTDHFSFAHSAEIVCRFRGIPLIHSMHTDVEMLTRTYGPNVVRKILGQRLGDCLVTRFDLGERMALGERRKLHRHLGLCDHVIVSRPLDEETVRAAFPALPVSMLRRGVNTLRFHPDRRDRAWLATRYGIPQDRFVLVFAGRADGSKRLMTAARAVRLLLDRGHDVAFLVAGMGADLEAAKDLVGPRLIAPGVLAQEDLALVFTSADLFVFPSESEMAGNVVLEARAAGLPVVLSARRGGMSRLIETPGLDGFAVSGGTPEDWAEVLEQALAAYGTAEGLEEGRRAARAAIMAAPHDWATVFAEDLAAVWRRLAATGG